MVRLKFVVIDDALKLRISEGKTRYYKSMSGMLVDSPNLERHWLQDKERFSTVSKSYKANNKAIADYKAIYQKLITDYPSLNAKEIANFYAAEINVGVGAENTVSRKGNNTLDSFLATVIEREKAKPGCNFECYIKLRAKCNSLIKSFPALTFQAITYDKCIQIAHIFAKKPGYRHTAKTFRALLGKASDDKNIDFNITQIGDFVFGDYDPNKYEGKSSQPDVLSREQLKQFMLLDLDRIAPTYQDRQKVELMHDFCVFMFHTFMAPCDVVKLKAKEISSDGECNTKRKKTHTHITVPINPVAKKIIQKYKGMSKYGYVFPIKDDERDRLSKTRDICSKKFISQVNKWLKVVAKAMDMDERFYAYMFRHTSITFALDSNLPISYVAQVAGTSIEMIHKHYYNGKNKENSSKLAKAFMGAMEF